ncbi:MAG: helix-turn-helix domain-containing protein [Prevotella sp.]|jgi:AraC-like DNA-binding protein|nr:helix-turn-helix domain-containing protein [Prevotella sp.]
MKLAKIQIEDISEQIDPYAIKNFIISDQTVIFPPLSSRFPFILDGVAFAICINGTAQIRINFREYEIKKNTIITIMPHFVTEFIEKSDDLMLEFLIFSVDFLTEMPSVSNFDISRSIIQTSCLQISEEEASKYLEFHSFIVKQYKRRDHPYRKEMAKSLLYAMLTEMGGIYYNQIKPEIDGRENNSTTSHQEELLYRFFELLLKFHRQERSMLFYADKMCLTPKYLSTLIKEQTGRTAFTWINEIIISSIKHMLKTTDKTILQISEDLNFPNASFFGRFFKKHTGMTPVEYRESK